MTEKRPDKAVQRVNELITKFPQRASYHQLLGSIYFQQRDNARAEQSFKKAMELDPKNVNVKLALTNFYSSTGQPEKSLPIYQELLTADPSNRVVRGALGNLYLATRSWDAAIKLADDALKKDSKDTDARILRGEALLAQGKKARCCWRIASGREHGTQLCYGALLPGLGLRRR